MKLHSQLLKAHECTHKSPDQITVPLAKAKRAARLKSQTGVSKKSNRRNQGFVSVDHNTDTLSSSYKHTDLVLNEKVSASCAHPITHPHASFDQPFLFSVPPFQPLHSVSLSQPSLSFLVSSFNYSTAIKGNKACQPFKQPISSTSHANHNRTFLQDKSTIIASIIS